MPFELNKTTATLKTVTPRKEIHGDSHVTAVSFGLRFEAPNTLLDSIGPALRHALYMRPEGQEELEGIEPTTPLLRCNLFEVVSLKGSLDGWTVSVDHGINEDDPMTFGGCKIDGFKVAPKQGGTVELHMRVGTSDISYEEIGLLCDKLQEEIVVTIAPPAPKADAIDGTVGHPGAGPSAGDLFADEHDSGLAVDPEDSDSEGGDTDLSPELEARVQVAIERSQPGTRTARGREKTKKALEDGAKAAGSDAADGVLTH